MRPDPDTIIGELAAFSLTLHEKVDAGNVCAAIDDVLQATIGHRLFTVMKFDAAAMEVQRVYSSNPDSYPPGGRKKKRNTRWGDHVLLQGEVFIGRTADDIRANFDDHDVIMALGLSSVLNIPMLKGGQVLGTLNLLHGEDYFQVQDVHIGRIVAGLVVGSGDIFKP